METKIYYGTSRNNGGDYVALVNESRIRTEFHETAFETPDGEYEAGWYVSNPFEGCVSGHFSGPYESEKDAYETAFTHCKSYGWLESKETAAQKAQTEAESRKAARNERKNLTPETAAEKLIAAGIFQAGWKISPRVWKKPLTKIRVQDALHGDPNAAGCLRRDAVKN